MTLKGLTLPPRFPNHFRPAGHFKTLETLPQPCNRLSLNARFPCGTCSFWPLDRFNIQRRINDRRGK